MSDMPDTTERRAVRSWFEMFCDLSEKYQALVAQQDEYRVPKSVFQAVRDDRNRLADELQALKPGASTLLQVCAEREVLRKERDTGRMLYDTVLKNYNDLKRDYNEKCDAIDRAKDEYEKLRITSADWQKRAAVWHRHLKTVIGIAWRQIPPLPDDGADEIVNALKAAQNVIDNGPEADLHWGTDGPPADVERCERVMAKIANMTPEEAHAARERLEKFCEEED